MSEDLDKIADRLKAAGERITSNTDAPDLQELRRRSNRHTGVRNALEFSFTHMFTTLLGLFAGAYHQNARDFVPQAKPNTGER